MLWYGRESKGFGTSEISAEPKNIPYGTREISRRTKSRNQGTRSWEQSPALPLTRPTGPTKNKDGEKEN
jgi:hypothetical protein